MPGVEKEEDSAEKIGFKTGRHAQTIPVQGSTVAQRTGPALRSKTRGFQ